MSKLFKEIQNIKLFNNISFFITMKFIVSQQQLDIEDGVTVDIKSRVITVKGPLGTLTRNFRHIPF